MAATTKIGKINVPNGQIDPVVQSIMDDLLERKLSKKEIANKHKVDLAIVCRIAKRYNLGAKIISTQQMDSNPEITNDKEIKIMEEKYNIEYQKQTGSLGGRREKLPDDIIISIVSDLEEGFLSNQEVANKNNVSIASVYRYGKEFGLIGERKKSTSKKYTKSQKPVTTKVKK